MVNHYGGPAGGLPSQTDLMTGRARFTESYAFIPKGVQRDIVTSSLPHWKDTRFWVIARPLSGFAETFSQYIGEIAPHGGSDAPESDASAEAVLFFTKGEGVLKINGQGFEITAGSYAYLPPETAWTLWANDEVLQFHWVRKAYERVAGVDVPEVFVTHENDVAAIEMPETNGVWSTQRFVDPADLRYDMHVNIVNFEPGGVIPFEETHVMEHGLYVLEGKAVYKLNQDWVEVEAGDFMWLRAFCPQACYASGPGRFRYLLYKDVNRHAKFMVR